MEFTITVLVVFAVYFLIENELKKRDNDTDVYRNIANISEHTDSYAEDLYWLGRDAAEEKKNDDAINYLMGSLNLGYSLAAEHPLMKAFLSENRSWTVQYKGATKIIALSRVKNGRVTSVDFNGDGFVEFSENNGIFDLTGKGLDKFGKIFIPEHRDFIIKQNNPVKPEPIFISCEDIKAHMSKI